MAISRFSYIVKANRSMVRDGAPFTLILNKSRYFDSISFYNCLVNNIKQSSVEPLYNGHLLDRRKWSFKSGWNKCEGMNCPPKMADNEWERIDLSTVIEFLTWTCSKGKSVESAGERSLKLFIYLFIYLLQIHSTTLQANNEMK